MVFKAQFQTAAAAAAADGHLLRNYQANPRSYKQEVLGGKPSNACFNRPTG